MAVNKIEKQNKTRKLLQTAFYWESEKKTNKKIVCTVFIKKIQTSERIGEHWEELQYKLDGQGKSQCIDLWIT